MIIDFHTHAFPDALAPHALCQLVKNAAAFGTEATPHTHATLESLAQSSRDSGIDISVVLPIATSEKPSAKIVDFACMADTTPGLRSFGSVHPRSPAWEEELDRIAAQGLRGIKLHPEYQDFFADDPACTAVVRAAAARGLWVLFHAGADIGMPPPIHCTPEKVVRLRQSVPDAKIILAHMGGYAIWQEVLPQLAAMDVYLDTSFSLSQHPEHRDLFAAILREAGTEKVLFGTDSPWEDQKQALAATRVFLQEYAFTAAETAAVLGGNARRILGC